VILPGGEPGTREEPPAHHSRGGNFGAPEQGPGQPGEPDQPDEPGQPGQGSKSGRGEPGGQGQRGTEQASRHWVVRGDNLWTTAHDHLAEVCRRAADLSDRDIAAYGSG
jgi:hypothetical protein